MFSYRALPRVEIDWPEIPETIVLIENACNRKSTRVRLGNDQLRRIGMLEYWRLGEGSFQFLESQFHLPRALPFG